MHIKRVEVEGEQMDKDQKRAVAKEETCIHMLMVTTILHYQM
jgi:hypothetical protein